MTFDGGQITTDGGAPLLREVDQRLDLTDRFAEGFTDYRDPDRIEHNLIHLLRQRVYALALGYEDLNDHDWLRSDQLLSAVVGKPDPTGESRLRERDQGRPLAGKSTLNRLEQAPSAPTRHKKITVDSGQIGSFFVETFLAAYEAEADSAEEGSAEEGSPPEKIVLDLDATDDPLHGKQEGRFFHGYYRHYCYLPLYVFCGDFCLAAVLRPSNIDASEGAAFCLSRLIEPIREAWPSVRIIVRGDSAFARERIMAFCEEAGIDYVFGLAKNARLKRMVAPWMEERRRKALIRGKPARRYKNFWYRTLNSWSRKRRVVAKIEHLGSKANPRFVVTSISREELGAWRLYEDLYCQRGEMENRIKEQQLDLFAGRTSTARMASNQLRLWFSAVAYTLVMLLRRWGLSGIEKSSALTARSYAGTIREKLLKIGARVKVSVRRVAVQLAEGYPFGALLRGVHANLMASGPPARAGP
jgi:peptidyl-tRNA hydrolase